MAALLNRLNCSVNIIPNEKESSLGSLIDGLSCASRVEIILPETDFIDAYSEIIPNLPKVNCVRFTASLDKIVNTPLLSIIRQNDCIVLSQSDLMHEDSVVITTDKIVLSLTTETYRRAGLVGSKSKKNLGKYVVCYNFPDKGASCGVANGSQQNQTLDRIKWAFSTTLMTSFSFIASFPSQSIDLAYLAECLEIPSDDIELMALKFDESKMPNVLVPASRFPEKGSYIEDWSTTWYEWLGLLSLKSPLVTASHGIDPYLSHYNVDYSVETPEGTPVTTTVHTFTMDGLFSAKTVRRMWDTLRSNTTGFPWFTLQVYADQNSPAWTVHGDSTHIGSENAHIANTGTGYSIVKLSNDHFMTYKLAYS